MMGSNSTEAQSLIQLCQLILEGRSSEHSIVSVVIQSSHSHGGHLSFKLSLCSDGFTSSEVDHRHHMNEPTEVIHKDDTTLEHVVNSVTPSGVEQPTRCGDNEMVHGDLLTRELNILGENLLLRLHLL